ncbi:MAG: CHAT domain-containing protein [Pyrinomonadaceae bacterium]|nr:CHAT domain-containing protein [Pyrinomonadaceae bacterium]
MTKLIPAKFLSPYPRVVRLCILLLTATLAFGQWPSSANLIRREAMQQPLDLPSLSTGAPIERELSGGQTHIYRIALSAGQFALVQVEQRGVEVVLTANGPDGKEFALVDLRIGGKGVEPLTMVADAAGEYILKVISRNPKAAAGRYEAKVSELRLATEQDRARVKAQSLCYEAGLLSVKEAPEAKRKAVQLYTEALLLWQQIPEPLWEAGLLWRLGRLHIDLTEFRQAKDYFSRGVIARRAVGDRRGEASAQNGVCEALHYLGDMKEKAECLDALIPIYREFGDRLEEAKVLSNIANTFRSMGDYQAALQAAQQALLIFQAESDRVQESFALNTLGQIYWSLNEHQLALDHYERALAIRREGKDKRLLGITLGDIGEIYYDLGDFLHALDYFSQALAISEEIGDRRTKAIRLQNLGLLWKRTGETAKALAAQTQSLALARAVGDRQAEGRTLHAISELYLLLGEKAKARDALTQALELARATSDPVGEAAVLRMMGTLAAASGDRQQAITLLQQSLSLARATGDLQGERDALVNLAQTERERNNLSEARGYHEKALELTESLRTKILHQELRASYLASRQDEYELYADLLMQMHQQQPNAGHSAAAFEISERGRARSLLETLTEARADIRQGADAGLLAEERKLSDRIRVKEQQRTKLIGNPVAAKQTAVLAKEIGNLLNEYQSLQGRIRAVSPRYAALTQPQPVTAAEIQTQHLDGHTVLLEFALGRKHSWMWAVTPSAVMSYELPPRQEIETAARKFYGLLTARQPMDNESSNQYAARVAEADAKFQTEASALGRMLLGPIASRLGREWKGKRLLIVASGALAYLPFAALPLPSNNNHYQPLIVEHEIVSLPSASVLSVIRRETAGRTAVSKTIAVLADPVFERNDPRLLMAAKRKAGNQEIAVNIRSAAETPSSESVSLDDSPLMRSVRNINRGTLSRLPFSREEANEIASLAPARSLLKATDFQASRAKAMSGELSNYRIIHFATHGLLNSEHPELSGLVLSLVDENGKAQDGFLRMHEIYNLRLPAETVVLSACQTALGKEIKGEGLVGLTRGFMYAGAQRVVASLWQVDDLATADLMKRFYRGMLKDGMRPAAALRAAQLEMVKQKRWSVPYFWAAFVIQGEWR